MKKANFRKGQTVYLCINELSDAARSIVDKSLPENWVREAVVTAVGSKYITVDNGCRFDANSLLQHYSCGSADYSLHLTNEEAVGHAEIRMLFRKVAAAFEWQNKNKYTLEQLKAIENILFGEEK